MVKISWKDAFKQGRKMNETVKKLYDASKEFRDTDWGEKVTYINFNTFAELIVNETLDVVYKSMDNGREIEDAVHKHFGIDNKIDSYFPQVRYDEEFK